MKCNFCGKGKTSVINSRKNNFTKEVWRRRECDVCKHIYTTTETLSYSSLFVVKRNLSRKRFIYEKLFSSTLFAIAGGKMRDMGNDAMFAKKLTTKIIEELLKYHLKDISSKEIIRVTYAVLAKEDPFFADRYATYSIFRQKVLLDK